MPSNREILNAISFLYEEWSEQPQLSFGQLLSDIQQRYSYLVEQPNQSTAPPVDWGPIKRVVSAAMQRYDFPEAQLKRDFQGTEYWDEGYRFDEEPEGLRLVYVNGLDLSEQAIQRCQYRQQLCNNLVLQLYKAAGMAPSDG